MRLSLRDDAGLLRLRPVYLHFLNRELARSVDAPFTAEACADNIALCAVASNSPLVSSLAFVWESGVLGSSGSAVVADLLASDQLSLVSEFASLDGFLESCRHLYRHDRMRYPMYFQDHMPRQYLLARPSLPKSGSTTAELERELLKIVDGEVDALHGLLPSDARRIVRVRDGIEDTLARRSGRALTLSLFQNDFRAETRASIGRLLSLIHLRHYLSITGATILRGVPRLQYYDFAARDQLMLDADLIASCLAAVGLDQRRRAGELRRLLAMRGTPAHQMFLTLLYMVVSGADAIARAGDSIDRSAAMTDWAVRSRVRAILIRASTDQQPLPRLSSFDALSSRLALLAGRLSSVYPVFAAHREERSYEMTRPSRVLILVATEVERDAVLAEMRETSPTTHAERLFLAYHTVFHLGIVGNVELLLAQSEQGTEAPGASTLTAVDLIDQCSPDYLVLTGICFGLRQDKQSVGDILVSTQIRAMDPKKVLDDASGGTRELSRGDRVTASVTLVDRFRGAGADWHGPKVHYGLLLSANTLVNSDVLRARLQALEPDAIGGEMEGAGAYAAGAKRKVDWVVVKAIADWGAGKTDDWQVGAARAAARLVLHVIRIGGLDRPPGT